MPRPGGKKRDNGRSVALGVAMGPFSPTRRSVMDAEGSAIRPLSRVRWAVPPSKKHRKVLPLGKDDYRKAQELRARNQPMLAHKTKTERERWLMDMGALSKPTDAELSMELYLKEKLSEIASPVVKMNDLRGLDQPKERNIPEHVKKLRAEKAKAEEERLRKSMEEYQRGEVERQEAARQELEDLKRQREEEQREAAKQREAEEEVERARERRMKKRKYPEPANVVSPVSSPPHPSPISKGKSVDDLLGVKKEEKSPDVQQLELDLDAACKGSSVNQVRMLLAMCPDGVRTKDVNGNTPLSIAASSGQRNVVELLLKEGSDVNHVNLRGGTPIARACAGNHREVVMMLLEYGSDELAKDKNNRSALDYASERLRAEIQKKKVQLVQTAVVADAMFSAVEDGDVRRLVSLLLMKEGEGGGREEIDANIVDKNSSLGWSLLHLACSEGGPGHLEIARLLIEQGVRLEVPDSDGDTPLHLACQGRGAVFEILVGLLLECGAHEARVNKQGRTPIFSVCIGEGSVPIAQQLLVHESHLRHTDSQGRTCLFYACHRGHEELATFLVGRGARIDVEDSGGQSPLSLCPTEEMADRLRLQRRAREQEDATASLVYACLALDEAKVEASISEGLANLGVRRAGTGESVLHCALRGEDPSLSFADMRRRQLDVLRLLVCAGNVSRELFYAPDERGWSPFHLACGAAAAVSAESEEEQAQSEEAADGLVALLYPSIESSKGASEGCPWVSEPVASTGNTPLHLALLAGRAGLAQRLLRDGALARLKNEQGHTPLHLACREGVCELLLPLLEGGGAEDLMGKDIDGKTPVELGGADVKAIVERFQREEAEAAAEVRRQKDEHRRTADIETATRAAEQELESVVRRGEEEEKAREEAGAREHALRLRQEQDATRKREREAEDSARQLRVAKQEFSALASEKEGEREQSGEGNDNDAGGNDLSRVSSLSNSLQGSDEEEEVAGGVSLATDGAVAAPVSAEHEQEQQRRSKLAQLEQHRQSIEALHARSKKALGSRQGQGQGQGQGQAALDDETMRALSEQFAALRSDWDEDSFRNLEGSYKDALERSRKALERQERQEGEQEGEEQEQEGEEQEGEEQENEGEENEEQEAERAAREAERATEGAKMLASIAMNPVSAGMGGFGGAEPRQPKVRSEEEGAKMYRHESLVINPKGE